MNEMSKKSKTHNTRQSDHLDFQNIVAPTGKIVMPEALEPLSIAIIHHGKGDIPKAVKMQLIL